MRRMREEAKEIRLTVRKSRGEFVPKAKKNERYCRAPEAREPTSVAELFSNVSGRE